MAATRTVRSMGRIALRCAVAGLLLAAGSAQATPFSEVDWYGTVEQGRQAAEQTARNAARQAEQELRSRRLPSEVVPALATTIRLTRDRARASGVRPAPANVIKALSPYFSTATLNQVRWRTPMAQPSMSGLLVHWYFREGAVTLSDVILFSDAGLAQDPGFWAHELTHVEQYRRYGVDGFARRYVNDWESLEREARQRATRIRAELRRGPVQPRPSPRG